MGIQNLLRFMKPFIQPVHIKKYGGKRVGIDAYSWLHKGAYSCSLELCVDSKSEKKLQYLRYFMHRLNLLRHHKIIPVVVFDGGNIPCKADTEVDRRRKRESNLALAREQLKQGNVNAATELFQRAVSITPSMAHQLIQILRSENIEFVVAPYEADAQLAHLSNLEAEQGGIAAVITEDSDLMAYGCQSVIFKMDRYGNGEEIVLDKVFHPVASTQEKKPPKDFIPSFQNFNEELFTGMCVLAGCDFLPSITGIGIRRAYTLVSKYRNLDRSGVPQVLAVLKFEKRNQMPEDYAQSFKKAVAVFHHARIYDASSKTIKPMKPLQEELLKSLDGDLDFLGPEIPSSIAIAIAVGRLDPTTMEAFDHFPKVEMNLNLIIQKPNQYLRADTETQELSLEGSCFTVFSSSKAREDKIEVKLQNTIAEKKYLNEAFALQKLVVPQPLHKCHKTVDKKDFPDNNPFKKRKLNDVCLDEGQSVTEQISVVTNVKNSDEFLCLLRESQESVSSKPIINITEVSDDQLSDEIPCTTPEPHLTVNLKSTKKKNVRKVIEKKESKLKQRNTRKTTESTKGSILEFFTRL
ncbi:hypothetical protein IFM89_003033 [Coptis chinensis]|uniref:Exonuclease 1 n=1 Tax=Coptis chinensis TaxID=261450 RepID=A0A835ITP0_9MAGN|nr:hypothetical protein IFM89_003033 [Coptis chinensis]